MIWSLLFSGVVLLVALLAAGIFAYWRPRPAATRPDRGPRLPVTVVGYRMEQVDDVVDRLRARVADNDLVLARMRGLEVDEPTPDGVMSPDAAAVAELLARTDEEHESAQRRRLVAGRSRGEIHGSEGRWWDRPLPEHVPPPRRRAVEIGFAAAYLAFAVYVLGPLLLAHGTGYLSQGVQDQQAFEWYFSASADNLRHLHNPFFSTLQNYPDGVNLMSNAAMVGLGLPLAPVTWLLGPFWTFALVELVGFAGTAFAWSWLLRRRLGVGPWAAFVGGWLCGFGPAMVSHGNGHPNFVFQVLVPVIIDRTLRLAEEGGSLVRKGLILGLLLAWQVLIGEEVLLLTAIGMLLVGLVLVLRRRLPVGAMLPGLLVAAGTTLALVGLPLWWQFWGPQSYTSLWHPDTAVNDIASLWTRATRTLGADPWRAAALSMNRTEENAFFGVPLLLAGVASAVALRKRPLVTALAFGAVVSAWLSLGPSPTYEGSPAALPGLDALFADLPLLDNVLTTRFTLITLPLLAVLLALGLDDLGRWAGRRVAPGPGRLAVGALAATVAALVVLVPVFPTSLVADPRPEIPELFTGDLWRAEMSGGSLLAAPPPQIGDARAMEWQMATGMSFPIVEGYFVGPDGTGTGGGRYGAVPRGFTQWLMDIAADNVPRFPTPEQQKWFKDDLRHWRTDLVVLSPGPASGALQSSIDALLGPSTTLGGLSVWDTRDLRSGSAD